MNLINNIVKCDDFNTRLNENFDAFGLFVRNSIEERFSINERNLNEILLVIDENIKITGQDINWGLIKILDLIKESMDRAEIYNEERKARRSEKTVYYKEAVEREDMHHTIMVRNQEKISKMMKEGFQKMITMIMEKHGILMNEFN
jgi:hypothetical protein